MWLCAAHRREQDSDDDAYAYFQALHESGELLPNDDDGLRDRAEAAIRVQQGLTGDLLELLEAALGDKGREHQEGPGRMAASSGTRSSCPVCVRDGPACL